MRPEENGIARRGAGRIKQFSPGHRPLAGFEVTTGEISTVESKRILKLTDPEAAGILADITAGNVELDDPGCSGLPPRAGKGAWGASQAEISLV